MTGTDTRNGQDRPDPKTEIIRALSLILEPGQVTELRILDATTAADRRPHTESGYFDDPEKLAEAVATIKTAAGVYFVPNPVNPDLLSRAANRIRPPIKKPTTTDHDIVARRWLLVDCDAKRAADISASDPEHKAAIDLAFKVRAELSAEGWPDPIVGDSGNGAHLMFRIDLPANDEGLVKRCLEALGARFDTEQVRIDPPVYNPARIWKLPGTLTCKGDNTPERPHRLAQILEAPDRLGVVDTPLLEALAATVPPAIVVAPSNGSPRGQSFDIDAWIQRHDLDVDGPEQWQGGRKWVFRVCPWNSDHTNRSAHITQQPSGALGAGCHHAGCQGKGWHDLRDIVEPGWQERHGKKSRDEEKTSQATKLIALAVPLCELWHTRDGDAMASIEVDGHHEHWPIKSKAYRRWLQRLYYVRAGAAVNAQALQDAIGVLEGKAIFDGREQAIFVRVAEHDGRVYLDLCNAKWQVVEIANGGWRIVNNPPVRFRRAKAMLPLPTPEHGGDVADLREFVNVSDDDWPLLLAWLVAAMFHIGPFPVLVFSAEQGSGKSTTSKVLRALIDPNSAPLRCEPREPRDLMIAANNGWLVALDNLSHLPTWLSDALCRLSTGGGFSTRTLYENDEETIFDAMRPVILNGIEEIATRGDLIDRSILITLPTIPENKRRAEAEFWGDFESARSTIMGAMLDALSIAIQKLPDIELATLPRMADFAKLATAAEAGLGLADGAFMTAYSRNRDDANALALESSPVAKFITDLITSAGQWEGTATELLAKLNEQYNQQFGDNAKQPKGWPKNGKALSGVLRRLAPNLRMGGLSVDFERDPAEGPRLVVIRKDPDFCVRTVQYVRNAENPREIPGRTPDAPDARRTHAGRTEDAKTARQDAPDAPDAKSPPCSNGRDINALLAEADQSDVATWETSTPWPAEFGQ